MPGAEVRLTTRATGADLRAVARQLRDMDDRTVKALFRRHLEPVAARYVPRVRAAVMAIPAKPEGRHTGLRARIATCAEVASWEPAPRQVNVAVQINPHRMPMGERGLPLYMEGVVDKKRHERWRHPVFGRRDDPWVPQDSHPYFFQAASGFGRAGGDAMRAAVEDITRQING